MGQDGNTIEIEIDAAATQAAAKTAGEANAKLEEFNNALKLFRDNVGAISKTTDSVAGKIGDFNTLLQTFSDKLTENLANMQTSVVAKVEPHLERELENLVNRVTNKVEAKYKPDTESRSRSEAKSGPAAPAIKVAQPPEYKQPDVKVKSTFTKLDNQTVDSRTGEVKETPIERARTTATRTRHWQEEIDGQLHDFTETITDVSSSVKKATTAEKDRGLAIRREITGALIGLHVMKVVSQYSAVFNAGFMQIAAAIGHLLNNLLLPMMPMFTQVAQFLHMLANVLAMLPMPVRQLIGALVVWKGVSMMVAGLPIKDFADGIRMVRDNLRGSGDLLAKFGRGIVALIKFMNTNLMNDKIDAVAGWAGRGLRRLTGKRAGGGPVLGHGAYIVGEKGPEIFVPKTNGTIIPNHKIGRAEGGDVTAAPFGGDILGNLGTGLGVGGLAYMLTGSPLLAAGLGAGAGILGPAGIANMIGSAVSSDIGSNMIASLNVMTGMISSILAPLAPIMGVVGALLGVVTGARAAGGGGGGDRTAETVAKFGNEQLKTTGKMSYGIQNATAMSGRGINKILSMILIRLGNCLYVAPCKPDSFATGTTTTTTTLINTITALPAAISVAITAALAALAGTITYTIITNGVVPIVTPISTTITYVIKTVGQIPIVENITRYIDVIIRKFGEIPLVQNLSRYIDIYIRKFGEIPTIQNLVRYFDVYIRTFGKVPEILSKSATYTYNIIKNGAEPLAENKTADITYNIRTVGTLPQTIGITYDVTGRITSIDFTKLPVDLAKVDFAAKITEVKVAEPLRVEKPVIDTTGRIVEAKPSDTSIPEIDVRGRIAEAKPSDVIIGSPPEVPSKGKITTIDVTGIDPPNVTIEPEVPNASSSLWSKLKTAIGERLGIVKPTIGPGTPTEGGWKPYGKTAGGFVGVGIAAFFAEWNATGTMPNVGNFLKGLFTATVLFEGAAYIATGIAGALGGPVLATAVGGAFTTAGSVIAALITVPVAAALGADLIGAIVNAVNTGDWSNMKFTTPVLKWFYEQGNRFTVEQGNSWVEFENNLRSTLAAGVPVDVQFDVSSITSVTEEIVSAARQNISGNTAAPPTNMSQTVGNPHEAPGPDMSTGNPYEAPGPDMSTGNPLETGGGGMDIGNPLEPRARGGPVRGGGSYLVGERGPEMFVPDRAPAGGGGGNTINFSPTFNVTTNNPKELTDTVMKQLKLELARVKM